jgi:hypothetical protein
MHSSGNQTLYLADVQGITLWLQVWYIIWAYLTLRHSSMLYYFNSVPIHIAHLMMSHIPSTFIGGSMWYNTIINCKQTARNLCRKNNTPEPSLCLPKDEQESLATFTHSQRGWLFSFTVTRKSNGSLFVKPQAELPAWLYGMDCTICIFCSGNTCICQHPSTWAQIAVGYNKAKGQMGYL